MSGHDEIADALNEISRAFGAPHTQAEHTMKVPPPEQLTVTQRRALACLACQLKGEQLSPDGAYAARIEKCTGVSTTVAAALFRKHTQTGALTTSWEREPGVKGHSRLCHTPTDTRAGTELIESLEAPAVCGMQQPRHEVNSIAEQYLIEIGLYGSRSEARRAVLGCLACQLGNAPPGEKAIQPNTVRTCLDRGDHNVTVLRVLHPLLDNDILSVGPVKTGQPGRPPSGYTFNDNAKAAALRELLEAPEHCGLSAPQHHTET
jgi:hypothetical protein